MRTRNPRERARVATTIVVAVVVGAVVLTASVVRANESAVPHDIQVKSAKVSDFVGSIGINVHETYTDTTYAPSGDTSNTVRYLDGLGVTWVRTGLKMKPPSYERQFLLALKTAGIKVLGITGSPKDKYGGFSAGDSSALVTSLKSGVYAGLISEVELPNELDLSKTVDWHGALASYDREYFQALRADPTTRGLPVVGPSVGRMASCTQLAGSYPFEDLFNIHPYTGVNAPESADLTRCLTSARGVRGPQGLVATEFGWSNATKSSTVSTSIRGIDTATSGRYIPRALVWNYFHGVQRSFVYELMDEQPDPKLTDPQKHFGLVSVSGGSPSTWVLKPKAAYSALSTLISTITGPAPATPVNPVDFTISATDDSGVQAYELTGDGGVSYLLAWTTRGDSDANFTVRATQPVDAEQIPLNGSQTDIAHSTRSFTVTVAGAVSLIRLLPSE